MKIGVIGRGMVGQTIQSAFSSAGHEIYCYDKNQSQYQNFEDVLKCDCVFSCVPTDLVNGQCDLTHVQEQIKNLANSVYSVIKDNQNYVK